MYKNYYIVLSDISKFSTVIEQQSVGSRRPQPLGALRRLPHLASRSYATEPTYNPENILFPLILAIPFIYPNYISVSPLQSKVLL